MRTRLKLSRGVAAAAILCLFATACKTQNPVIEGPIEPADDPTIQLDDREANDRGTQDVTGEADVAIEVNDYYFEPTVFEGVPGQTLSITITNPSENVHNFSTEGQDVDIDLLASVTITLDFPESGQLVFFCKYHHQLGMAGALRTI